MYLTELLTIIVTIINLADGTRPNILLIIADDMSPFLTNWIPSTHPMYGKTQNIDKLMKESHVFTNANAQIAVCGPSRTSMLTGLRPDTTKIYDFDTFIPAEYTTIPKYFKSEGYDVQLFGKVFHPHGKHGVDYYADHATRSLKSYDPRGNSECGKRLYCTTKKPTDAKTVKEFKRYVTERQTEWMAIVGLRRPHTDLAVPNKFLNGINMKKDTYETWFPHIENISNYRRDGLGYYECAKLNRKYVKNRKRWVQIKDISKFTSNVKGVSTIRKYYYAAIKYVDALVGEMISHLKAEGVYSNTIIVFTSDHGWSNGENGMFCKNSLFEQSTKVPLIIKPHSEYDTPVAIHSEPVELIDIFPTLLHLYGGTPGAKLEGRNIIINGDGISISQYPRCVCNRQIESKCSYVGFKIPKYLQGVQFHPCTTAQAEFDISKPSIRYMGYKIIALNYTYIEWRYFDESDGQNTDWSNAGLIGQRELYHYTDPHTNLIPLNNHADISMELSNMIKNI